MEVVPLSVGAVSRHWDEEHLDLAAAAGKIGGAPTGGFTAGVSGAAARFVAAWERHATALGDDAEVTADLLRSTIADYVSTDNGVAREHLLLRGFVREAR